MSRIIEKTIPQEKLNLPKILVAPTVSNGVISPNRFTRNGTRAMSDPYLLHLEETIEAAKKQLQEANMARDNYLRFKNHSPHPSPSHPKKKLEDNPESDRKGLRAFGLTRDLYEYYYRTPNGANTKEAVAKTGYTMKQVSHFQHRAQQEGTLVRSGDKYVLSEAGISLVEKSRAYEGGIKF